MYCQTRLQCFNYCHVLWACRNVTAHEEPSPIDSSSAEIVPSHLMEGACSAGGAFWSHTRGGSVTFSRTWGSGASFPMSPSAHVSCAHVFTQPKLRCVSVPAVGLVIWFLLK